MLGFRVATRIPLLFVLDQRLGVSEHGAVVRFLMKKRNAF